MPSQLHPIPSFAPQSLRLVPYKRNDHRVEIEKKHDEMKAKLNERFLFIPSANPSTRPVSGHATRHTFLCTLSFLNISVASSRC